VFVEGMKKINDARAEVGKGVKDWDKLKAAYDKVEKSLNKILVSKAKRLEAEANAAAQEALREAAT
jgi:hypothetical protein